MDLTWSNVVDLALTGLQNGKVDEVISLLEDVARQRPKDESKQARPSMHDCIELVRDFHDKLDVSPAQSMRTENIWELIEMGQELLLKSKRLESKVDDKDGRWLRAHLEMEELGEKLVALGNGDQYDALDATCDQIYVLFGTAVMYGWDLEGAFLEVHRSNMTKTRKTGDPGRVRDKGTAYSKPDLTEYLRQ